MSVDMIRAFALVRCKTLGITDPIKVSAFADRAQAYRDAGNDSEPALRLAHEAMREAA